MSTQVAPPSLGADWKISLAEITAFPVPASGLPTVGSYVELGCVTDLNIELPSQEIKKIRCGLNESRWTRPGNIAGGNLTLDSRDFPDADDELMSFNSTRCVVKAETLDEEEGVARTMYLIDWMPKISIKANRDGDSETGVSGTGAFQRATIEYAA